MSMRIPIATHWGNGTAVVEEGRIVGVEPHPADPAPAALLAATPALAHSPNRIRRPAIRRGWLERGPGGGEGRGREDFVEVDWNTALDLAAREIDRVRRDFGNAAIFAGSYGWASAGRFHHAQSQIHRFYRVAGGYTKSVDNYSYAAALVVTPHIVGPLRPLLKQMTAWPVVAEHGELVVMFGGLRLSNTQIAPGGIAAHVIGRDVAAARAAGVAFVNISPRRSDAPEAVQAEWLPIRPNTDVALMLGLCHTLIAEGLHDAGFLARCTVGFARFRAYLTGETDGRAKDADWASAITGIEAAAIRALARRMASRRTLVTMAASLQRAEHGEQAVWATIALAALLGQIGLPGGGFGLCYGADGIISAPVHDFSWPALPQPPNPVAAFIPVARIADMLENPGGRFTYDGGQYRYPDIRLIHWAGGNPFHHHQDLNRLRRAWARPETVIVNDIVWTATARHADIVLPATSPLEREDICINPHDDRIIAMGAVLPRQAEARDDYEIFSGLAERLGCGAAFTEGLDAEGWQRRIWGQARQRAAAEGIDLPDWEAFRACGEAVLPKAAPRVPLAAFRADPEAHPLATPSGRIELFSERVAGFGLADCPGHAAWFAPSEWLGVADRDELHLISSQPPTRLHSQLDDGPVARAARVAGREPLLMHPADAAARGLEAGEVVRVFNARGACLAGLVVSDDTMPGVVHLATGARFCPDADGLEQNGNPNVLTRDVPTSGLAQGPSAQTALVRVERWAGG